MLKTNLETIKPGDPVYGKDGKFLGEYVDSLTDNPQLSKDDLQMILKGGTSLYYTFGNTWSLLIPSPVYGVRDVFSKQFGSVLQFLVKSFGDLVWINAPATARLHSAA